MCGRIVCCVIMFLACLPTLRGQEDHELSRTDVKEFLSDKLPHLADRLKDIELNGPDETDELLQEAREIIHEYRHLREVAGPKIAEAFLQIRLAEHQIDEQVEGVHDAESDRDRAETRARLIATVGRVFDLRLKVEEAEIAILRREVDERASELRERRSERDAAVRNEVETLLDESEEEDDEEDLEELRLRADRKLKRLEERLRQLKTTSSEDSDALAALSRRQIELQRRWIDLLAKLARAAEDEQPDLSEQLEQSAEPLRWRLELMDRTFQLSSQRRKAQQIMQARSTEDTEIREESRAVIEVHDEALELAERLERRLRQQDPEDPESDEVEEDEEIHPEKLAGRFWDLGEYADLRHQLLVRMDELAAAMETGNKVAIKLLTSEVHELKSELGAEVETEDEELKPTPPVEITDAEIEAASRLGFEGRVLPLLHAHCTDCHGPNTAEGEIDLVKEVQVRPFVKRNDVWEKVRAHIRNRVMPPEDAAEMPEADRRTVLAYFAAAIDNFDYSQIAEPGYEVTRRLTHTEYDNTLRDLLGVDLRLAQNFPTELTGTSGFENSGNTLFLHRLLVERYFGAAEKVVQSSLVEDGSDAATERRARILFVRPGKGVDDVDAARKVLSPFLDRAYRRPASAEELNAAVSLFRSSQESGSDFEDAIKAVLQMSLVSPKFLLRIEAAPPGDDVYRISDWDLASRLSYFLWSSMPDDELFRAANAGDLFDAELLRGQVDRMLDDPKSMTLGTTFAGQWLGSRNLGVRIRPDPIDNPWCTDTLIEGLKNETALFVHSLIVDNQPISRLVDAEYTYLNEEVAKHYRIDGVQGDQMRRVDLQGDQRGGIFGQGSLLAVTSFPGRTSPVVRGKWILTDVLGTPPPPPPPNVSEFSDEVEDKRFLSSRQKLQLHRRNPNCYSCHSQIDPLGFSLENYDWFGRWRSNLRGRPVDSRGKLPNGTEFEGPNGLQQVIVQQRLPDLRRQLTKKMLAYALGRQLEFYDEPAVRTIIESVEADSDHFRALIYAIVESYPFQYKKSPNGNTGSSINVE